jgi:imidazolonepropionase
MDHLPKINADKTIDATGKWFYPLDVTVMHIVYAGNRTKFVDRINGMKKLPIVVGI